MSASIGAGLPMGPSEATLQKFAALATSPLGPQQKHATIHNHHAAGKLDKCPFLKEHKDLRTIAEVESNARGYVRKFPMVVKQAEGCTLVDTDGRRYLDFLGCAGTLALGHNHPVPNEAIRRAIDDKSPQQTLDLATPKKLEFIDQLFQILPEGMRQGYRVQFCGGSGSDAIEAAVKLCKIATGRSTVLAFHGAYHGMGQGPLAMMGNLGTKGPVQGLMPGVQFLPYPNNYRQPFGLSTEEGGAGDKAVMTYIEHLLKDDESGVTRPACVVLEVIQGEGGLNMISNWALKELRRICTENDIPLIVDEIQSGFCRSGQPFSFMYSGILPDIVTLSKAAGGGQPLACVVFKNELDKWSPAAHTGTFRGNGLAFAAGAAALQWMRENKLWEQAAKKGEILTSMVNEAKLPYVGNVRGSGMMVGIEVVDPAGEKNDDGLPPPSGDLAGEAQAECFRQGLLIERGGRSGAVIRPLMPLIVTEDELRQGTKIIIDAIQIAGKKMGKKRKSPA